MIIMFANKSGSFSGVHLFWGWFALKSLGVAAPNNKNTLHMLIHHAMIFKFCGVPLGLLSTTFCTSMPTRIILAEQLHCWGNGDFQSCMDTAYKDFVSYCRIKKLDHSQPPFTTKMVLWQACAILFCSFLVNVRTLWGVKLNGTCLGCNGC